MKKLLILIMLSIGSIFNLQGSQDKKKAALEQDVTSLIERAKAEFAKNKDKAYGTYVEIKDKIATGLSFEHKQELKALVLKSINNLPQAGRSDIDELKVWFTPIKQAKQGAERKFNVQDFLKKSKQ